MQKKLLQIITVLAFVGVCAGPNPTYADYFQCFLYPNMSCEGGTGEPVLLDGVKDLSEAISKCSQVNTTSQGLIVQAISNVASPINGASITANTACLFFFRHKPRLR